VTRNVDQVKDVVIYSRFISKALRDVIIEESHTIQFLNFPSIMVGQIGAVPQPLPVRISLVISVLNIEYQ